MKTKIIYFLIILLSFIYSQCPDGLMEDDCGECWQPYCYCLSDHTPNFDISQSECEEVDCWWIGPGGTYEPGDYEFCLFDLNSDGVINVIDIISLVNMIIEN